MGSTFTRIIYWSGRQVIVATFRTVLNIVTDKFTLALGIILRVRRKNITDWLKNHRLGANRTDF